MLLEKCFTKSQPSPSRARVKNHFEGGVVQCSPRTSRLLSRQHDQQIQNVHWYPRKSHDLLRYSQLFQSDKVIDFSWLFRNAPRSIFLIFNFFIFRCGNICAILHDDKCTLFLLNIYLVSFLQSMSIINYSEKSNCSLAIVKQCN